MRTGRLGLMLVAVAVGAFATYVAARPTVASSTTVVPRTADGRADLNGIWQAVNTAY